MATSAHHHPCLPPAETQKETIADPELQSHLDEPTARAVQAEALVHRNVHWAMGEGIGHLLKFDVQAMRTYFKREFEKAQESVSQIHHSELSSPARPTAKA